MSNVSFINCSICWVQVWLWLLCVACVEQVARSRNWLEWLWTHLVGSRHYWHLVIVKKNVPDDYLEDVVTRDCGESDSFFNTNCFGQHSITQHAVPCSAEQWQWMYVSHHYFVWMRHIQVLLPCKKRCIWVLHVKAGLNWSPRSWEEATHQNGFEWTTKIFEKQQHIRADLNWSPRSWGRSYTSKWIRMDHQSLWEVATYQSGFELITSLWEATTHQSGLELITKVLGKKLHIKVDLNWSPKSLRSSFSKRLLVYEESYIINLKHHWLFLHLPAETTAENPRRKGRRDWGKWDPFGTVLLLQLSESFSSH